MLKIIDANRNLSIQVHPNDQLARKNNEAYGKHEMWYIIESREEALITTGFKERLNAEQLQQYTQDNSLVKYLNQTPSKEGDCFNIPAGKIHTIGKGNLLAEIQQCSNTTFRIYDYNRHDAAGNKRELHLNESIKALDFNDTATGQVEASKDGTLINCSYFTVKKQEPSENQLLDYSHLSSFVVILNLKDTITFKYNKEVIPLHAMETLLIPASIKQIELSPSSNTRFLEVYI